MKKLSLLLFLCLVVQLSQAQATFEYDAAGNRIKRNVIGVPDLVALLSVLPGTTYGTATVTAKITLFEINNAPTTGPITLYITKDPLLNLTFNPTATFVGGTPVQNPDWSFDNTNPDFWILSSSTVIEAGESSVIGLGGVLSPGNSKGVLSISLVVVGGSGGETNTLNNLSATRIEYFNK